MSAQPRRGAPGGGRLTRIATWTPQHRHATSALERFEAGRDRRHHVRRVLDDRLVELGLVRFEFEGLGADLWPLAFDEVYPNGWHPGDEMAVAE